MSRRRGEFEHRTSIFEGAFRAWSHLGGLSPEDVESKSTADLDPLNNPLEDDPRLAAQRKSGDIQESKNLDGSPRRDYPYEPLPRSGLAHPYVQAILSPWLGPDADNEAIQLGLTTLRTWWQHRRKGESGSAIAALGTEKMKGVVEGYTRHFFTLAHCLVTNDKEQPPRTLHGRMKELEKVRNKKNKKKGDISINNNNNNNSTSKLPSTQEYLKDTVKGVLTDASLTPLERLHAAQRRQLASTGMIYPEMPGTSQVDISLPTRHATPPPASLSQPPAPIVDMKGKCVPSQLDLVGVAEQAKHSANPLAHRGGMAPVGTSSSVLSSLSSASTSGVVAGPPQHFVSMNSTTWPSGGEGVGNYGDPNLTPVVFVSSRGDIMIAMSIDGITCAHCVKIVETVLKGCQGNKSPIDGLLDAAADQKLAAVLIKIDKASNAKRIAFEAIRNLSMVGYTARAKEMGIVGAGADKKATMDLGSLCTAFEVVANSEPKDFFDWRMPCTCPDNGVLREDCQRHSQMNLRIFEAFDCREKQVADVAAGCGMRYGMACNCGPDCRCKNCVIHGNNSSSNNSDGDLDNNEEAQILAAAARLSGQRTMKPSPPMNQKPMGGAASPFAMGGEEEEPIHVEQKMEFFGLGPPRGMQRRQQQQEQHHDPQQPHHKMEAATESIAHGQMDDVAHMGYFPSEYRRASIRNPSIISYGGLRHMSMNSETTFGRAMSGLSALSIDWENLEDFDLDVDHSAHINNHSLAAGATGGTMTFTAGGNGGRRSSIRRPYMAGGSNNDAEAHVSFKV